MFRRLVLIAVLAFAAPLRADGPDDKFVVIYNLIQQADKSGSPAEARRRYSEARVQLQQLQAGYPAWNERVINFRLRYCAEKLAALPADAPAPDPAAVVPGTVPTPDAAPGGVVIQLNDLNQQIQQLQGEKKHLESRLREALTAQPAPVDPRELQAAVERITSLQQTNKVLLGQLEQQQAERKNLVDKVVAEEAQKALQDANRQLADQRKAAARLEQEKAATEAEMRRLQDDALKPLKQENQSLKQQVTELKSDTEKGRQVADLAGRLARLQGGLDDLKQRNEQLVKEKAALERQVDDLKARQSEEGIVRVAKLETELAVARADAGRNAERARELAAVLTEEKAARTDLEKDRTALTQQNLTLQQRVAALTAESAAGTEVVRTLQTSLAAEKSERAQLEAELKAAEAKLTALSAAPAPPATSELAAAGAALERDASLRAFEAEVAKLRGSLRESSGRETELQAALTQESALRARLQNEKTDLERRLTAALVQANRPAGAGPPSAAATATTRALEARVRGLERERDEFRQRLLMLSHEAVLQLSEYRRRHGHMTPREHAAEYRGVRP